MERLTAFDGEFWIHKNFPPVEEDRVDEFIDCVKDLASRLATIENIIGNNYDLERLKELVEADKEGKCVVLPCKVGQDAWFYASTMKELCKAKIIKAEINFFTPRNPFWLTFEYYSSIIGTHEIFSRADLLLGKTLFLSKEEAEVALEKMKKREK